MNWGRETRNKVKDRHKEGGDSPVIKGIASTVGYRETDCLRLGECASRHMVVCWPAALCPHGDRYIWRASAAHTPAPVAVEWSRFVVCVRVCMYILYRYSLQKKLLFAQPHGHIPFCVGTELYMYLFVSGLDTLLA